MPASREAPTTPAVAASSRRHPKLLQPIPTVDASRDPILLVSNAYGPFSRPASRQPTPGGGAGDLPGSSSWLTFACPGQIPHHLSPETFPAPEVPRGGGRRRWPTLPAGGGAAGARPRSRVWGRRGGLRGGG